MGGVFQMREPYGSMKLKCRGVAFEVPGLNVVAQPWSVGAVTRMIKTQLTMSQCIEKELGAESSVIEGRITGRSWRRACAKALLRAGASSTLAGQRMHTSGSNAEYYGTETAALFSKETNYADVAVGAAPVYEEGFSVIVDAVSAACRKEVQTLQRAVAAQHTESANSYVVAEQQTSSDMRRYASQVRAKINSAIRERETSGGLVAESAASVPEQHDGSSSLADSACRGGRGSRGSTSDVAIVKSAGELEMDAFQAGVTAYHWPAAVTRLFNSAVEKYGGLWNVTQSQLEAEFPRNIPGHFAGRTDALFKEKLKVLRKAARKRGEGPTQNNGKKRYGGKRHADCAHPVAVSLESARENRRHRMLVLRQRRDAARQASSGDDPRSLVECAADSLSGTEVRLVAFCIGELLCIA